MSRSICSRLFWCMLAGLGVVSALPSSSSAQEVRGTAVEAASEAAIEGAFVSLVDEAGSTAASALTGSDGNFLLRATLPGSYRLRVERIGYVTWTSDPFEAGLGRTVTRRLRVSVQPVMLEELAVRVESQCRPRPGAGPALAATWEEARKALEVTRWTERRAGVGFELRRWERALDPETERVRDEESHTGERRAWRTFVSAPVEELSAEGYVRRTEGRAWQFFAPDAEALLSDTFADDHCFSVVKGEGEEAGLTGLSFEPVPGRVMPDVEGVLWLDGTTSELRHLAFTYTNPGFEPPLHRFPAGGRVEFARLPTGHWFVRRWHVRVPVAGARTGVALQRGPGGGPFKPRRETVLARIHETGGETVQATLPDGETVALAHWGAIEGTVRDTPDDRPLADMEVELVGTAYRSRTDPEGGFRMDPVPPGDYTLVARHPEGALLGLAPSEQTVSVGAEDLARVELAVPSMGAALATLCPLEAQEAGRDAAHLGEPSALIGYVREAGTGAPAPGARVWVSRADHRLRDRPRVTTVSEERQVRGVEADSAGVYVLCGLAGDGNHLVQAETETAASDTASIRTRPGDFRRMDLEVIAGERPIAGFGLDARDEDLHAAVDDLLAAADEPESGEVGLATLVGTVQAAEDGRPVAGARVRLLDGDEERVTGQDGAFVMTDLPRGRYRVVTEHLGMASDTVDVDLRVGAGQVALFTLETRPVQLPTLEVEIERTFRSMRLAGFYGRMHRGIGDFITREDIEARDMVANMRRIPSVRVDQCVRAGLRDPNCWNLEVARGYSMGVLGTCPPLIYLDGHLIPESSGGDNAFTRLQNLSGDMLEGIEVYRNPAGAPGQYRMTGDACGIVLVWTRGR